MKYNGKIKKEKGLKINNRRNERLKEEKVKIIRNEGFEKEDLRDRRKNVGNGEEKG